MFKREATISVLMMSDAFSKEGGGGEGVQEVIEADNGNTVGEINKEGQK